MWFRQRRGGGAILAAVVALLQARTLIISTSFLSLPLHLLSFVMPQTQTVYLVRDVATWGPKDMGSPCSSCL